MRMSRPGKGSSLLTLEHARIFSPCSRLRHSSPRPGRSQEYAHWTQILRLSFDAVRAAARIWSRPSDARRVARSWVSSSFFPGSRALTFSGVWARRLLNWGRARTSGAWMMICEAVPHAFTRSWRFCESEERDRTRPASTHSKCSTRLSRACPCPFRKREQELQRRTLLPGPSSRAPSSSAPQRGSPGSCSGRGDRGRCRLMLGCGEAGPGPTWPAPGTARTQTLPAQGKGRRLMLRERGYL